jgi:hypothetical protein
MYEFVLQQSVLLRAISRRRSSCTLALIFARRLAPPWQKKENYQLKVWTTASSNGTAMPRAPKTLQWAV